MTLQHLIWRQLSVRFRHLAQLAVAEVQLLLGVARLQLGQHLGLLRRLLGLVPLVDLFQSRIDGGL